jgi:hypothetical protein
MDYASSILDTEVLNMSKIESEAVWEERKTNKSFDDVMSEDTVTYQK